MLAVGVSRLGLSGPVEPAEQGGVGRQGRLDLLAGPDLSLDGPVGVLQAAGEGIQRLLGLALLRQQFLASPGLFGGGWLGCEGLGQEPVEAVESGAELLLLGALGLGPA